MPARFILLIATLLASVGLAGQSIVPVTIHWADEATDTVKINDVLNKAIAIDAPSAQARVGRIARMFEGKPYKASTLEIAPEGLVVNLDSLDCTTFVENVAAIAITVAEGRNSWQDFLHNLTSLRYRGGLVDGYASRLHYISEWILDNEHRGNLQDVTDRIPQTAWLVKSIEFMSEHRDSYPALADDREYERVKNTEIGYRNHRFPYIKTGSLHNKPVAQAFRDGDIVALVTRQKGLDVSHMGFVVIEDGKPHLLHASLKEGRVVVDKLPLDEYMRKARNLLGLRVVRLKDR